jgi:hypothetical protein
MKFQNIEWKKLNPPIPFRTGELSVQASAFHYCHPKNNEGPYSLYEVAYRNSIGDFAKIKELEPVDDQVYGYVNKDIVIELLESEGYNRKEILTLIP